ncbi:conserved hypothetical protein [Microcystis aeruginosa PCC 9443]|uniref:PEP-CTERM protein-sorting domain-containing protein n=1 Tax=Microcystis aeruginosa PCC 9443 TaxID=1160281 RepID=I4G023_MICAE|nr:conserved hypothetical protein [Microcystis aeruginosa PCC 9443]
MRDKSQPANYHPVLSLGLATSITLGILSTLPNKAIAFSFTGPFAPSNWTLTNTNADGSVDTTNAATGTIVLTGGNNGSNSAGTTDWTIPINASRAGNISFNWSYFTLDTPGFDSAGYLLNGIYTPLATQDGDFSAAPVSLNVNIGDVFGFRTATDTNSDGPPVFTVFAVPTVPVPEPSSIVGLLAVVGLGAISLRKQ